VIHLSKLFLRYARTSREDRYVFVERDRVAHGVPGAAPNEQEKG
jgi:hypothetical protein